MKLLMQWINSGAVISNGIVERSLARGENEVRNLAVALAPFFRLKSTRFLVRRNSM